MKKIIASILIILILPLGIIFPVAASSPSVAVSIESDIATVFGTSLSSGNRAVIRIDAPDGQIYYIGSADVINGAFDRSFQMLEPMDGTYSVRIKIEDMEAPLETSFKYETPSEPKPEPKPVTKITASAIIVNGKVTVKGNIHNGIGDWVNILVYNGDKIDYAADTTCNANGDFTFEYQSEAESELIIKIMGANISAPITVPQILVIKTESNIINVNGEIPNGAGKWVTVLVEDGDGKIDYASDDVCDANGKYAFQYTTESRSETLRVKVNAQDWEEALTAEVEFVYDNSKKGMNKSLDCIKGEEYTVVVSGTNIGNINAKTFIMKYDPDFLEAVDFCAQTYNKDLKTDLISGTDITVTEFDKITGTLKFQINKDIQDEYVFSGVLNTVKFKAKTTGSTSVNVFD